MAAKRGPEIDYSKSTMAFPMDPDPQPLVITSDVDYSKPTGAYPMYDEPAMAAATTRIVEHVDADGTSRAALAHTVEHVGSDDATGAFPTPGPSSSGVAEAYKAQRAELGLSDDASGESDRGYEARPSSVPVPGADGVDRDVQAKVVAPPVKKAPTKHSTARGK